jgi:DNA-directed RNA polymerase sigma subunit (sigma70/sigma32)
MASSLRNANDKELIQKALASLRRVGKGDPGKTAQEIADETGVRIERVRAWIKAELAKGRIVPGWRPAKGIDQRSIEIPVYAVKGKP